MQCRRPRFDSWVRKILWRRDRLPTPAFLGFPGGSAGKESSCNAGNQGSIPGWEDPLRRERQPTPVFWPRQFHGLHIVHGGHKKSDTTERLSLSLYSTGKYIQSPGINHNGKDLKECTYVLLLLSRFSSIRLCATPWTVAHQALLSVGFSRQEYWSGFPCPPPGDVPDLGIEPRSPSLWTDSLSSLSHFVVQQRLSQRCKSTILQFFEKQLKSHLCFAHSSPFSLTPGKQ